MNSHEQRIEIFKKYAKDMKIDIYSLYVDNDIPKSLLANAIKKYAKTAKSNEVIALCDGSLFNNGKSGFLFTDNCFYFTQVIGKPECVNYTDISRCSVLESNDISISLKDGSNTRTFNSALNHSVLIKFLEEIKTFNESVVNSNSKAIIGEKTLPIVKENINTSKSIQDSTLDTDVKTETSNTADEKKDIIKKSNIEDYALADNKKAVDVLEITEFYLSLDEETQYLIGFSLLLFKLTYLAMNKYTLDDEKKKLASRNVLEITQLNDNRILEYIKLEIEAISQNKTLSFDDLIEELNLYPTEIIEQMDIELKEACYNEGETAKELCNLFSRYLNARKKEDKKQLPFSQRHPFISGMLTEVKNDFIQNAGTAMGAKQSEIDSWKKGGTEGFFEMMGRAKEVNEAIKEAEGTNTRNRSVYNDDLNNSTNRYDAAMKRKGIDLKYYKSLPQSEKQKYLKERGINSQQDLKKVITEVNREVLQKD